MAEHTGIEWTDATWQPITGCTIVSPGCTNCYAMQLAGTRLRNHTSRVGLTQDSKAGPVWTGEVRFNEQWLDQPLRWKRPRRIFVCAHGDLFHESVPDEWIDRVFAVMALAPQHTFQVLTKRATRMREYLSGLGDPGWLPQRLQDAGNFMPTPNHPGDDTEPPEWPLPNVWLGVSVEDRARKTRIDDLRATPAAVRFLSLEPLLEDLGEIDLTGIGWVIVGGESGPKARTMHPDWARSLRDQCAAAGVPFFFKQWGEWAPGTHVDRQRGFIQTATWWNENWSFEEEDLAAEGDHIDDEPDLYRVGKKAAGRLLDGVTHDGMPG